MYNFADSTVTASAFTAGANTGLTLVASTAGLTTTASLVIYYDDQVAGISGTVTAKLVVDVEGWGVNLGVGDVVSGTDAPVVRVLPYSYDINQEGYPVSATKPMPISGTVTANPTGTQTIAGDVSVNPLDQGEWASSIVAGLTQWNSNPPVNAGLNVSLYASLPAGTNRIGVVTIGGGTVTIGAGTAQIGSVTASISGTVPVSISSVTVGNSVTIASLPAISGTVTANSSNGSLTTRFGSVTTANTAFATSAVTNANRKYLLIQNITTASNVITIGIGFTPTTTQGIQLSSGAGLTFESSYIPTGAVNLLSSVTASCFTILEA
jgi:hypothetical protein